MKRKAILFAIAFACAVMAGHLFANRSSSVPMTNNKVLLNYTWYMDEDMTEPNGAYSSVAAEINRLQALYPANIFTTVPQGGTVGYEWGYYPSAPVPIIYSDK
jgi:hypothetical protein